MCTRSMSRPADPPSMLSAGRGPQTSVTSIKRTETRALRGFRALISIR